MRKINYPIVSNHYRTAVSDTGVCSCTWAPGCEVATSSNTLLSYIMWRKPLSSGAHCYAELPALVCTSSGLWISKFWWKCCSAWLLLTPLLAPAVILSLSVAGSAGGFMPGNCNCWCQGSAPQPLVFVTSSHSWLASICSVLSGVYNQLETFFHTKVCFPLWP